MVTESFIHREMSCRWLVVFVQAALQEPENLVTPAVEILDLDLLGLAEQEAWPLVAMCWSSRLVSSIGVGLERRLEWR